MIQVEFRLKKGHWLNFMQLNPFQIVWNFFSFQQFLQLESFVFLTNHSSFLSHQELLSARKMEVNLYIMLCICISFMTNKSLYQLISFMITSKPSYVYDWIFQYMCYTTVIQLWLLTSNNQTRRFFSDTFFLWNIDLYRNDDIQSTWYAMFVTLWKQLTN